MNIRLRELAERWNHKGQVCKEAGSPISGTQLIECATELLSILDAEGDGGAVAWGVSNKDGELWVWDPGIATISKESAVDFVQWANDSKREQRFRNEAPFRVVDFYTHPARPGGVSDADVEDARQAYVDAADDCFPSLHGMRTALTHFVKGERHE